MKVLFIIDALGVGGGAEHSLAELLPELRIRGIDCSIVCLRPRDGGLQERMVDEGFPLAVLRSPGFPGKVAEVRRILRAERPDLVHATLAESCLVARFAAMGSKIPVINSLVNNSFEFRRKNAGLVQKAKIAVFEGIDGLSSRQLVHHFHAVTQDVKRAYMDHLHINDEDISVIYRGRSRDRLGFPSEERRRAVRKGLGIPPDQQVTITVGRQDTQKNQVALVRAFGDVWNEVPDAWLLVAGREGTATDEIVSAVEASERADRILLLGHRDDVPDLLAASDIFALPSSYEGIAGVLIEAMAMALPVVASDLPGLREVLREDMNAMFVPPGDASALARALVRLMNHADQARRMGEHSRELFEQSFSLDRCTAQTIEMYRKVVGT